MRRADEIARYRVVMRPAVIVIPEMDAVALASEKQISVNGHAVAGLPRPIREINRMRVIAAAAVDKHAIDNLRAVSVGRVANDKTAVIAKQRAILKYRILRDIHRRAACRFAT